ncbi:MAG: glycoside hydrolase family 95 protein [Cellvibrio sp.]|nr:glycoside hydrolase family 95 protein [Cellvibrio sp.]
MKVILRLMCLPIILISAQLMATENRLWYSKSAGLWEEALPLGNGRLGAMVYGDVLNENIQLNESTFWAGGPHNNLNPAALKALPELRRLLDEGEYLAAEKLSEKTIASPGPNGMPYQTAGNLHLQFPGHEIYQDYYRDLNLDNAVATTRYKVKNVTYTREVFASFVDQVIVIKLTASKVGQLNFSAKLSHPANMKLSVQKNTLVMQGVSKDHEGVKGQVNITSLAKIITQGGSVKASDKNVSVENADSALILISMATNFINYHDISGDADQRAQNYLDKAEILFAADYEQRKKVHSDFYRHYFTRVQLDLGANDFAKEPTDKRIQLFSTRHDPQLVSLYFQFGRYLLISSSQPGGQPANLQGIWNHRQDPAWDSKYTLNINAEMNYWPSEVTNLTELNEPFISMIKDLAQTGQESASKMYGARGWMAHHNTDIWRTTGGVDWAWSAWPTSNAWLSQHLWEKYLYSGDKQYLASIYPILKSACAFYEDFLVKDSKTGWLIVTPSMSPENAPKASGTKIAAGVTMDNQLVFDLFSNGIKAAEILKTDKKLIPVWKNILQHLPPMQIGQYHQLQEWMQDWDDPHDNHRHISHLYGLYPSNQISPLRTPDLFSAARVTMEQRGDPSTGWSMNWKINLWARLLDGDRALKLIREQIKPAGLKENDFTQAGGTYPNMFDAHPPFQIDGNFGFTSGVAEMLAQSHDGAVHLLPALPQAWPEGEVKGLVMRGGFVVDMRWSKGRVTELTVHSRLGGNLRLRSYSTLPSPLGFKVVLAKGDNPNPFYLQPSVKPAINHSHKQLPRLSLDGSHLIDVSTRAGQTYHWQ